MNSDRFNPQGTPPSPQHERHIHPASDTGTKQQGACCLNPMMIDGFVIPRRESDGYYNPTAICDTCSQSFENYMREERTAEILDAISSASGIPREHIIQGCGAGKAGGPTDWEVWIHPNLANDLAQWCSPGFAVEYSLRVSEFFEAMIATNSMPALPPDCPPEASGILKIITDGIAQGMRNDAERN